MFKFKKVASIVASAAMLSSTVALAAATTYPAPFVSGGAANVAVVYGTVAPGDTDLVAATKIVDALNAELTSQAGDSSSEETVVTELPEDAAPLFTSATKIYFNSTLASAKSALTKRDLPTILEDGTFSGNVDATYTQMITLGTNPKVTFTNQPTSSDDPAFGIQTSTTMANYIYNATATFNRAVAINATDSKGAEIVLFGQKFTISSATDATSLILLKSAEKTSLTSENPTATVTVGGKTYTVELVSASTTTATLQVTDENQKSDTKEVTENASPKKIQGLTIAVTNADSNNLRYSASIVAGAEKVTLVDGSAVTMGENDDVVDGTKVSLTGGLGALTKLTISVAAPNSDNDAIMPGDSFQDPVFGSFYLDFNKLNIPVGSEDRETIAFNNVGDDRLEIKMTDYNGNEKSVQYAINASNGVALQSDQDGRNITVFEKQPVYRNELVMIGNQDEGFLMKVAQITNQTSGYANDKVRFTDYFSGDSYDATLTGEGVGTVTVGGKIYDVNYFGSADTSEDGRYVRLGYPDSSDANTAVAFTTVQTSKGARVSLYEPLLSVNISNWDGGANALTTLKLPDGDGYGSNIDFATTGLGNFTVEGTTIGNGTASVSVANGKLNYTFTHAGPNLVSIYLADPTSGASITSPSVVIWEPKDDATTYNALVVTSELGATSDDGIGVESIIRTWDGASTTTSLKSNTKKAQATDRYGVVITVDSTDSDQKIASISLPSEQVAADVYIAPGTATTTTIDSGKVLFYKDTEMDAVKTKNLIVVGGSCVNTVAATLLGSDTQLCGSDWTAKTSAGDGSWYIKTFENPYASTKIATLVAGYNAADTTNAATYFRTQTVDTTKGKGYTGTTDNSATPLVE